MSGFDVLFDRRVGVESLQTAIAKALKIPLGRVAVIESVEHYPDAEHADCVCLLETVAGQFPVRAAIDYSEAMWPAARPEFAVFLAHVLQCNCLISDESVDPYTMVLATHQGAIKPVSLDVAALDERNEYKLDATSQM